MQEAIAKQALAHGAVESGLHSHEIKIDRSQPVRLKRCVHIATKL